MTYMWGYFRHVVVWQLLALVLLAFGVVMVALTVVHGVAWLTLLVVAIRYVVGVS